MKEIKVAWPNWLADSIGAVVAPWTEKYTVVDEGAVKLIFIGSTGFNATSVVVSKVCNSGYCSPYYISVPSAGVAIERAGSLRYSRWIAERLLERHIDPQEATTIAAILAEMGDF